MLPTFARGTVTRLRATTSKTERGSTVPDWSKPASLDIPNCLMVPGSTMLNDDGRVLGVADIYTCFLPIGSDVVAGDRIRFDSKDYTILGDPRVWYSPSGAVSHITLNLERWYG